MPILSSSSQPGVPPYSSFSVALLCGCTSLTMTCSHEGGCSDRATPRHCARRLPLALPRRSELHDELQAQQTRRTCPLVAATSWLAAAGAATGADAAAGEPPAAGNPAAPPLAQSCSASLKTTKRPLRARARPAECHGSEQPHLPAGIPLAAQPAARLPRPAAGGPLLSGPWLWSKPSGRTQASYRQPRSGLP